MDFRKHVIRTCPNFEIESLRDKLSLAGLGVSGEAGEVTDLIKKVLHHGKPLDREKLIEEMGDVYWYLEYLGATLGVSTNDVQQANIRKLNLRYPNGFNFEDANIRADVKARK